jgi:hypothetical protein
VSLRVVTFACGVAGGTVPMVAGLVVDVVEREDPAAGVAAAEVQV